MIFITVDRYKSYINCITNTINSISAIMLDSGAQHD
jgi:hypothetical protein